jgi:hypothetical protein
MSSKARASFDANAQDVRRLLQIHRKLGGKGVGRRVQLEVIHKSAMVLITAFWEAYCEDIAAEALENIVTNAPDASHLTKALKKQIAKELKESKIEIAVWDLADGNWKTVLKARLKTLAEERNRNLNTPKAENIDTLFDNAIGLGSVSSSWKWNRVTPDQARKKLDRFVTLRGDIAHRGSASVSCGKKDVLSYIRHVDRLVSKTGGRVNTYTKSITGVGLW